MDKNARIQIAVAAFFGFSAVISGALGAHALEDQLVERGMVGVWETAVLYHLTHAVALLALGIWSAVSGGSKGRAWVGGCWTLGVLLFSGSLYILALGGPGFLGPVTPLGGLFLIAGWVVILGVAWSAKSPSAKRSER